MGIKLSQQSKHENEPLSQKTVEELCVDTGFTEEELFRLHANFYKDCPNGKLTLKQFQHEYSKIMGKPGQKTLDYVKHMFNVYDKDKNQFIDFREFVMALSAASGANGVRLVETLFSMFDLNNDGKITKDEIGKMLHTLVAVTDSNRKNEVDNSNERHINKQAQLQKSIDEAFHELNLNNDDFITKSEFMEWYIDSGFLSNIQSYDVNTHEQVDSRELQEKSPHIEKQYHFRKKIGKDKRNSSQIIYMSRMLEKKSSSIVDNNDDFFESSIVHQKVTTDDNDSHNLQDNNRWNGLFNSTTERSHGQVIEDEQQYTNSNDYNRINHLNPLQQQNHRHKSEKRSSSPDIITTWF
ncbi:unnamed protein product [Rotaria magnacalcarata]|uniref:EF-hand domain-containing protein n=2 Tax=Rotaria magnacalcarata TaxID=392030 RepID=A0A819FMN2_9BILA|nr:unnamed protein product [Rotaria magnacalcarata]CAF2259980.1 unnamed protein product [Rotaria magnacalcarata]CAF3870698.1 unnamed protein product [Rotaria magnacalcarata]CAF3925072.1 unnamed protein product [Rotaria magnacalcarata]